MKLGKYLFVPWLVLAVHTALSVYSGAAGIVPYRELLSEREKVMENLDRLQTINQQLEGTMDALLYDAETIRVRARELGYGAVDERFIRIVGLPGTKHSDLRPGMIRSAVRPRADSGKTHRIIALCMGFLLLGFFLAGDTLQKKVVPAVNSL